MGLIDTHCHLHFSAYDTDREAVLQRIKDEGMMAVTIGTGELNSIEGIRFADLHDGIYATVGLHPDHVTSDYHDPNEGAKPSPTIMAERIVEIAHLSNKCIAIGECGLDFYRLSSDAEIRKQQIQAQEQIFFEHVKAADILNLPIVIHCREALPQLVTLLTTYEPRLSRRPRGVIHSFTGTWEEAQPLLELGWYLGINGIATFAPKKSIPYELTLPFVIERMPLEQLVLETDAPYLAPVPHRGEKNEPALLKHVAQKVALVRGLTVEEIERITTANAKRLFHFA